MRGWFPHSRGKGGADTGPSPVDRRKTGGKHHLICDGRGTPLKVITTAANIKGMGKLRYVVEQTFVLLHHFKRLAVRWERRTELHDTFVSLTCSLICYRRLKKTHT